MIILDTETTGIDSAAEICEISMIDGEGNVVMDTLVKPTTRIPNVVINIHGITNEMVADAPTWADLHTQFESLIKNQTVCIYNATYDLRLLQQTAAAHGLALGEISHHCVMLEYAKYAGEWNDNRGNWKWHKLIDAAPACDIQVENAHRALGDCKMTLGVMNYMQKYPRN